MGRKLNAGSGEVTLDQLIVPIFGTKNDPVEGSCSSVPDTMAHLLWGKDWGKLEGGRGGGAKGDIQKIFFLILGPTARLSPHDPRCLRAICAIFGICAPRLLHRKHQPHHETFSQSINLVLISQLLLLLFFFYR